MNRATPVLRWPGAKWSIVDWIIEYLPPHIHYVELFFGSGAVFFSKPPSKFETINDIDGNVVNLFKIIRTRAPELAALIEMTPWARDEFYASYEQTGDELEDARRFLVRTWQSFGAKTSERSGWRANGTAKSNGTRTGLWNNLPGRILQVIDPLKNAQIENHPAISIIKTVRDEKTLLYCDPPYIISTRGDIQHRRQYKHEMTDDEHVELLETLKEHPGPVMLSSYPSELYKQLLVGWTQLSHEAFAEGKRKRKEVLWLNPVASRAGGLFERSGIIEESTHER